MSDIIYGLYEQIINEIITENLNKVDQKLIIKETQSLDTAESSKILADYLTKILREIFDYIDEGDTIVRDRVNLCNGILQYITECIQKVNNMFCESHRYAQVEPAQQIGSPAVEDDLLTQGQWPIKHHFLTKLINEFLYLLKFHILSLF